MYKHSTTHRTLSRRLAALLAALALLAAMALPVYAEALDGATQMQETVETDNNGETDNKVETGSDVEPDDKSKTNEGTGVDTDSEDTNDNASQTPGANSTAPADNATADNTAPYEEKTDLTEEDTADDGEGPADEAGAKETFFAADTCSEDETGSSDMSAPMAASNEGETTSFIPKTATIYFAVDSAYQDTYRVNLYVQKKDGNGLNKDMSDTGKTIDGSDGKKHKIFSVTLSQADYPGGGFDRLIFQYFDGPKPENWKNNFFGFGGEPGDNNGKVYKSWTSIDKIAGKMFDGQIGLNQGNAFNESQWTRVEYYYAGMPLYFKNASDAPLAGVTATFYKKDETGDFVVTGSQTIGTVEANTIADQKITIPNNQSQLVKFTWEGNGEGTLYYNFSNDGCDEATPFDLVANNCFVYSGSAESTWKNVGGDLLTSGKTIYFDATLSSYAYTGDGDIHQKPMPGKDGTMYCYLTDGNNNIIKRQMTLETADDGTDRQLWYCTVPEGGPFTAVQFSAHQNAGENSAVDALTKQYSTAEIPPNLKAPCFFADDGDPSAYAGGSRDGYWGEKGAIRDAESGKGTTVVDIAIASKPFTQEAGTKYITSTLYDYYTDYELNGFNRDSYPDNSINSQRWYVTFEQFDRALSSAYEKNKNVKYPLYTGHFQPSISDWSCPFAGVAAGMNLYGWGDPNKETEKEKYNTFMAVNNSALDINGKNGDDYTRTFQGLVEDKTSTGDANGLPVLKGTTNLVDPHFNKEFLEGKNTFNTVLGKVYEDVAFPFTKGTVFANQNETGNKEAKAEYWYYDSSKSSLYLTQDKDNSKLFLESTKNEKGELITDSKSENRVYNNGTNDTYGFFPFNKSVGSGGASQYNYGFGAKLQFDFTLTDDGMVQVGDKPEDKVPIKFFFSGDDDVWVYIDGQLVLDVGGAHGKASGLLEFGKTDDGKANTVTPYVSSNKTGGETYTDGAGGKSVYFNGKEVKFEKKGTIHGKDGNPFTLDKGTTHTLTMFYMERGMWESNMAVAFNFPDHNELQVEKEVDVKGVNNLFKNCFTDKRLFNFTILNQATHYGPKPVDKNSYQQEGPIKLSDKDYTLVKPNDSNNRFELADDPATNNTDNNTGQVIYWYAKYNDTYSKYRKERMGVIKLNKFVGITDMDYLSFDIYAKGEEGEGVLSLSNMYLQLVDNSGNVLGCNDEESLSGTTYNQVDLENNKWINIKLDLSRLKVHGKFDRTKVVAIRIGDNYQRHIYFKDFTFTANPTVQKITGFTTEQDKIPDYGSAATGELKPAENAQFSSSIDGETRAVDENGQFTLQDKEVVTFSDQFRRGSYLSVTEDADATLFDTTWTIYENGVPVKTMNTGKTVQNANPAAPSVVEQSGCTPNDGRTENVVNSEEQTNNEYKVAAKPAGDKTIVFRSYTNPDAGDAAELTKLKLQFVNKVKTGSLTIEKKAAAGEEERIGKGTYTFMVTFTGVGGLALESKPIEKPVTINGIDSYTISGIPVGTRFHIVETKANNGANVSGVTVSGGGTDCKVVNGKEAIGTIVEGNDKVAIATFTNTMRTLIDIDLTKKWVNADNKPLEGENLPNTIYVQLQRKTETQSDSDWKPVDGTNQTYVAVERDNGGWTHKFTNLDADVYTSTADPKPVYQYRVVEGTLETKDGSTTFKPVGDDGILIINGNAYKADSTTADKNNANITLTNKRLNPKFNLDILKKSADEPDTPLKGVEFTLEKLTADGKAVDVNFAARIGITNAQGEVKKKGSDGNATEQDIFHALEAGTYRLTETKAAKDYNLLSEPITIIFSKNGKCKVGDDSPMQANENKIFTGNAADGYTLKLTVLNRKTPALPHTGADAPSLWLLIGLPLAVAGLLILVFRYNKKGGRTR